MRVVPWMFAFMAFALIGCDMPNDTPSKVAATKSKSGPQHGGVSLPRPGRHRAADRRLGRERQPGAVRSGAGQGRAAQRGQGRVGIRRRRSAQHRRNPPVAQRRPVERVRPQLRRVHGRRPGAEFSGRFQRPGPEGRAQVRQCPQRANLARPASRGAGHPRQDRPWGQCRPGCLAEDQRRSARARRRHHRRRHPGIRTAAHPHGQHDRPRAGRSPSRPGCGRRVEGGQSRGRWHGNLAERRQQGAGS